MLAKLMQKFDDAERRLRKSFGRDLSTPRGRFMGKLNYHLMDHAFLRVLWTNFFEVAPDVYRSNHPTPARIKRYAKMGIKSVLNLRGEEDYPHYFFEKEACEANGLTLINAKLHARHAVNKRRIQAVIDALRTAERPLVFHCKSGADRAGFVAAVYQIVFEGASVEEAKKQLSIKYAHLSFTKTGVQGYILDIYAAQNAKTPIDFETWLEEYYSATAIQAAFDAGTPADEVVLPHAS